MLNSPNLRLSFLHSVYSVFQIGEPTAQFLDDVVATIMHVVDFPTVVRLDVEFDTRFAVRVHRRPTSQKPLTRPDRRHMVATVKKQLIAIRKLIFSEE